MAKKTRTPAPPRKVQAPQRRTDPKRPRSPEDRRFLLDDMLQYVDRDYQVEWLIERR